MAWIDVAGGSTAKIPADGRGSAVATAVSTFTPSTLFIASATAVTAGGWPAVPFVASSNTNTIDGAWGGGGLTPAIGDLIVTTTSSARVHWGIVTGILPDVVTISGPTTFDAITVDRWRVWGSPDSNVVPTAGDDLGLYRGAHFGPNSRISIESIEVRASAAGDVTINNLAGTAIKTVTCIAAASPFVYSLTVPREESQGEVGWDINGPFSVTTAANLAVTVNFRVLSNR
jgi:hypothetical protein